MIALVPSSADLERLPLDGGELRDDLHLTLAFLGEAANWTPGDRGALVQGLANLPALAVVGEGFGANYWNPDSDSPSWNLAVGGSELEVVHGAVWELLHNAVLDMAAPEIPEQRAPWAPHICLAYSDDVTLAQQVAERVGPISFDRLRVAFGEHVQDLPLSTAMIETEQAFDRGGDVTAAATEPTVATTDGGNGGDGGWEGVLVVEGIPTGDGRQFSSGALTWAELPLPLKWQEREAEGHDGAVIVGRIDSIEREGDRLVGRGVFDLDGEHGREAHRLVSGGYMRGVSIQPDDISDSDVELVFAEGVEDDGDPFARPELIVFNAGRVRSATLCAEAAFVEAEVRLTGQPLLAAASLDDHRPPAEFFTRCTDPIPTVTTPDGRTYQPAIGARNGRVWGYAAHWRDCHIGYPGVCTSPPQEDDFAHYLVGEVLCAGGERVPVGQITMNTGHASTVQAARTAAEHYDHTGAAVADVVVGADDLGIWFSGALRPGADEAALRAAGSVSGDWRRINGSLRLVAVLAVNVAGFQQVRARVASGVQTALVAAGQVVREEVTEPDLSRVKLRVAKTIGRDLRSRREAVAARVGRG